MRQRMFCRSSSSLTAALLHLMFSTQRFPVTALTQRALPRVALAHEVNRHR